MSSSSDIESDAELFSLAVSSTQPTFNVQSDSSDDMDAETSDTGPAIGFGSRKRKVATPMPKSSSEDSLDFTQDTDDVVVLTASASKNSRKSPLPGTSRKAAAAPRKRNNKKVSEFFAGLTALTVAQLAELIEKVVEQHPEMKSDFVRLTPSPDLAPLENKLNTLSRSIEKAFPWTKFGSDRDAFCYRRVKGHVIAFQQECVQQTKSLIDSQQWKSSIDYVMMAWEFVHELPDWDDQKNNKHKEQCYKKLIATAANAIKKGTFAEQELQSYIAKFKKLKGHNEVHNCIAAAQGKLNKM